MGLKIRFDEMWIYLKVKIKVKTTSRYKSHTITNLRYRSEKYVNFLKPI